MAKNKGLGRGLGALFQEVSIDEESFDASFAAEAEEKAAPAENKGKNGKQAAAEIKTATGKKRGRPAGSGKKAGAQKAGTQKAEAQRPEAQSPEPDDENSILYVDINDISPNAVQPRRNFDPEKIKELADSIVEHGLIQPVVLRRKGSRFELVAGERRWRAAREAGLKSIPALVRSLDERQNMLLAIIENTQREDLNPIEEAEAIRRLAEDYELTQEEIAKSLGKSRPYIANAVRLLKLPEEIKGMVSEGSLSAGHARALIAIESEETQISLARRAASESLSVREMEKLAADEGRKGRKARKSRRPKKAEETESVERELKEKLGTRVNIVQRGKRGKLEIEYYSREELERLVELLLSL